MAIRVAINGFGRIGRGIVRALMSRHKSPIELVAINDLYPIETLAHLLKYDSVHGPCGFDVKVDNNSLLLDQHRVSVSAIRK